MKKSLHFLGIFTAAILFAPLAYAAEILILSSHEPLLGETIVITLTLDAKGDSLNALEGTFVYPESLKLKEIRDGNSLVNFWLERPQGENGTIRFAGITPGGYAGSRSELFALVFEVQKSGEMRFTLQEARAFLNDGEATRAPLTLSPKVQVGAGGDVARTEDDATPPELFAITRSASPDLFDGGEFIVFASQDKESGIARYEVAEGNWLMQFGVFNKLLSFKSAESPYAVKGKTNAYLFVKAIDAAGNVRLSVLSPEKRPYSEWIVICLGILLVLGLVLRYARTFSK